MPALALQVEHCSGAGETGDPQGLQGPRWFGGESHRPPPGSGDTLTGPRWRGACAMGRHRGTNTCGLSLTPHSTHRPHVVSSRHTFLDAKQNGIMRRAYCPVPSQLLCVPCAALQFDLTMIKALQLQWTARLPGSSIPGPGYKPELIVTRHSVSLWIVFSAVIK